ncbi:hypothetical protein [Bdellovibrio sp. HCB337]|uniref:hypothetical protein n=1 Tax=Bdellovibrio sp. HCB337 TaxID=3394358 RepID=UPI0039A614F1
MYRHVHEAMILNEARKPLYAELTDGRSLAISEALISYEKDLLLKSRIADITARPFQWAGVPIVCEDYISINATPQFKAHYPSGAPLLQNFVSVKVGDYVKVLEPSIKAGDFKRVEKISHQAVEELSQEPRLNCMVRHFLESIRRVAGLAEKHDQKSRAVLGVGTKFLSKKMLIVHLDELQFAADLDKMAAPLQAAGVPILCQDVPAIPRIHVRKK